MTIIRCPFYINKTGAGVARVLVNGAWATVQEFSLT